MGFAKIAKNSTLKEILKIKGAKDILLKYSLPCLSCPMAAFEIENLKLEEVCKIYGLDAEEIVKEINDFLEKKGSKK
ncbi:disulfide oxidoreductase [Candidatus Parcubacteria bacterium]|nr:disulfide oxidoreductase [Candidatus Parcubacteria bacterium]